MEKTATTDQTSQGQPAAPAMTAQVVGRTVTAQAAGQNTGTPMPGLQQVQQQVAALRQTLQALMADKQSADGEIITATAVLDTQLEDYTRTLSAKKQPALRTF